MCEIITYLNNQSGTILDLSRLENLKPNSLLKKRTDLWCEWDFKRNNELMLDIYKVSFGIHTKAWWVCSEYPNHKWDASIRDRVRGSNCPYCANRKILIGFNDMWTTNPKLASLLADEEDGYKYMQFSHTKLNWKCNNCDVIIFKKAISDINIYGLSCSMCSDGIKYPEKVMREILKQLNIEFIYDTPFHWSQQKRYDFYIPSHNMIIEMHGGQHVNGGFKTQGGRNLEEEIANDSLKKTLAVNNNIEHYFEINAHKSNIIYLKKSIENSNLSQLINLNIVDWCLVEVNSQKSISHQCLSLWNEGYKDIVVIAEKLLIHNEMVRRYLKQWSDLEKCDFNNHDKRKRKILQLGLNGDIIKIWDSITEASNHFNVINNRNISNVLTGLKEYAFGFKWVYEDNYNEFSLGKTTINTKSNRKPYVRKVVKLTKDSQFLSVYDSIAEAAKINNIKSFHHVTSCCRGRRNYCGGFKWMYKEDYEKIYGEIKIIG